METIQNDINELDNLIKTNIIACGGLFWASNNIINIIKIKQNNINNNLKLLTKNDQIQILTKMILINENNLKKEQETYIKNYNSLKLEAKNKY